MNMDGDIMKATFMQRLLAYFIDLIIVSVVVSLFTVFIDSGRLNNLNKELTDTMNQVVNNSDEKINVEEMNEKILDLEYQIQRESVLVNSINVVIILGYFVVFQYLYKGQTLGKKLFKIRIVDKNNKNLSFWSMLYRNMITQGILPTFLSLITIVMLSKNGYMELYFVINSLMSAFVITCALMILYRKDRRGLHDMMAGSIVVKDAVE